MLRTLWGKKEYFPDDAWIGGPLFKTRDRRWRVIMDAALLLARYGKNAVPEGFSGVPETSQADPGPETQRAFLICLLVSPRPELGLKLLKGSGFLDEFWSELARFDDVDQSKEFHPEGNVWNHTLETFRYRKKISSGTYDLRLSLGLLLHDIGKPISASFGSRRFDGHAELGAKAAARFLERLEFEPSIIEDIFFLVKNHMLPAALKRLPLTKTSGTMASPLFPTLMELYRCDESSSFKGLDCYHENSAAYQAYLKNLRNPYRYADGKKMGRREMYSGNLKG
jgi:poly(A) polymerase